MTILFKNGYFKMGHFEQFIITDKLYKINDYICDLFPNRVFKKKSQILLEENDNGSYITNSDISSVNNQIKNEPKKLSRKQKKNLKSQRN